MPDQEPFADVRMKSELALCFYCFAGLGLR